jgi:branched-subunit amino acid aminotransferase/4-amino-4-deoxychorismate lyase
VNKFILEIVNHSDGQVIWTAEGTPEFIASIIRDELRDLAENEGITITRRDDE